MPVKLDDPNLLLEKAGSITRDKVVKMVDMHRSSRRKDKNTLKFAHFTVLEVLTLLKNNGIINDPASILVGDVNNFGVKIYSANHANDKDTVPQGRQADTPGHKSYLNSDTVVICNTVLDKTTNTYRDMLTIHKWVTLVGQGDGLDKGTICPPDCPPAADPDGYYHEDISTIS